MKFIESGKSGTGFCLNQKPRSSVQKCKLKNYLEYDVIVTSRTPCDTHFKKVINRAKSDACTSSTVFPKLCDVEDLPVCCGFF